jgi:MFS transporter, AAHS family, 4-hydroxybenzoate transporter
MAENVNQIIEREKFGSFQKLVLALISIAIVVDGFDIQTIAFVGPVLGKEWGISRAELAPAISAALAGMAIGAPVGGWIGDKWGRRIAIVGSVLFFGLASFPAALATNIWELAGYRFVAGLGFGAVLPNATAMIAEWMPSRIRSYAISMMIVGVPVGGFVGAATSSWMIAEFGWQSCFVAGGLLGLTLSVLLWVFLPESPHFLVKNSEHGHAVVPLLNRAFGLNRFSNDQRYAVDEGPRATWSDIFSNAHRRITIGLAIAFTAGLMVFYGLANWIPSILTAKGVALPVALQAAMIFNLSGLAGAIGVAALVSRIGSRMGLLVVLCSAIATVAGLAYLLGQPNLAIMPVMVFVGLAGGLLAGLQVALYALAAWAYPTDCRATGVGFSAGI